jgi:hypothetical protein
MRKKSKTRKRVTFGVGGASSNNTIIKAHPMRMYGTNSGDKIANDGKIVK